MERSGESPPAPSQPPLAKKDSGEEPAAEESPKSDFIYFKIGFWDGLSPIVGGGLFL